MNYEDELDIIEKSLAPPNLDELLLGMYLAFFVDWLDGDEDTTVMREGAETALAYWRVKYNDEIRMLGGNSEESIDGNGQ